MNAVTEIRVVVARMIPNSVRKVRSLFFESESIAMRLASQKDAVGRNFGVLPRESLARETQRVGALFLQIAFLFCKAF